MDQGKRPATHDGEGDIIISITEDECQGEIEGNGEAWLARKMTTTNGFNVKAFKTTMAYTWRVKWGIEIRDVGKNLSGSRKKEIRRGFYRGTLELWQKVGGAERNETREEVDLSQSLFWIRGYNVPIGFRTQKVATMIEGALGEFVEWDGREESWLGLFICIKVMIDISKPLRKGLQLKLGGKKPRRLRVK